MKNEYSNIIEEVLSILKQDCGVWQKRYYEHCKKIIDKKDNIIRVRSSVCGMLFGYRGGYSRARNILVLDIN